jgi:O-antigen/teichoic acid export membrane protein
MLLSHVLPGIKNRLAWDHEAARSVLRFGRWIFVSTLLTFLVSHADRLIFAAVIPVALLGVYSIALLIASFPALALLNLAQTITFPLYSRTWREAGDLVGVFRTARARLLLLGGWALAGLIAGGPTAIELLYDERYRDAGWMVQILAAGGWFGVLEATTGAALLAREQPYWVAAGNAGKLLGMVAFIPLGFAHAGFPGALVGFCASELLRYAVSVSAATRVGLRSWPQDIAMTGVVAVSALAGWLGAAAVSAADGHVVVEALVVFVVVSLVWTPVLARALRRA